MPMPASSSTTAVYSARSHDGLQGLGAALLIYRCLSSVTPTSASACFPHDCCKRLVAVLQWLRRYWCDRLHLHDSTARSAGPSVASVLRALRLPVALHGGTDSPGRSSTGLPHPDELGGACRKGQGLMQGRPRLSTEASQVLSARYPGGVAGAEPRGAIVASRSASAIAGD